ncbi:unnamed protein product [Phytomonas sp. Hart1]|nr:unnamed protein product [Phytomonas sp. Hart1]|eukprot:CCW68844.1 unnamed protein product [Phytomonas sp. isolate Hart1]
MFCGISKTVTLGLTRQERRLLTIAEATKAKNGLSQRYTYKEATRQLARFDLTRRRHRCRQHCTTEIDFQNQHLVSMAVSNNSAMPKPSWRFQENTGTEAPMRSYSRYDQGKQNHSNFATRIFGTKISATSRQNYDDVDQRVGISHIQIRFDKLVHAALLQCGPPLPAEFVADNDVVTASSVSPMSVRRHGDVFTTSTDGSDECLKCSMDFGTNSANHVMYDEVGLKPHELMRIVRLYQPSFSIQEDCDYVPFSMLVKNCPYFRAFGGKIHYMRYLQRRCDNSSASLDDRAVENNNNPLLVSIGKYKMREVPSQDGVRQGPKPWLYPYEFK